MKKSQTPRVFKSIIDLLVYGNVLIGFCAFSLSEFFLRNFELTHNSSLPYFLFAATTFTYNFHRRIGYALSTDSRRSSAIEWMLRHSLLSRSISLIALVLSIYFYRDLPSSSIWVIIPISILSLLYVQRLSEGKVLREVPFLKIFVISLVWALAIIALPASIFKIDLVEASLLFFAFFLFMIAEIIPFDVRDIEQDQADQIMTIPIALGSSKSKIIAYLLLLFSNFLIWISAEVFISLPFSIASIYLGTLIYFQREDKDDYFYSIWVESSLIIPWILQKIIF